MLLYSITSSASASSVGGTVRPSVLAVLRLMTQLELGRLHHRKVGGLLAFENSAGIQAGLPIHVADARTIAHQTARHSVLAQGIDRRHCVLCRQRNDPIALTFEDRIGGYKKGVDPFSRQRLKGGIKIPPFVDSQHFHLPSERVRHALRDRGFGLAGRRGRVHENTKHLGAWKQIAQQGNPLRHDLAGNKRDSGDVAAGTIQAGNEPERDGIAAHRKDDRNFRGRGFCRSHRRHATGRGDHRHAMASEVGCHVRQPFVLTQSPAVFDRDALAFDVAFFREAVAECSDARCQLFWRSTVEKPDHGHRRLLRPRRERPRTAAPPSSVMNSRRFLLNMGLPPSGRCHQPQPDHPGGRSAK